jgi:hypothetical protein
MPESRIREGSMSMFFDALLVGGTFPQTILAVNDQGVA